VPLSSSPSVFISTSEVSRVICQHRHSNLEDAVEIGLTMKTTEKEDSIRTTMPLWVTRTTTKMRMVLELMDSGLLTRTHSVTTTMTTMTMKKAGRMPRTSLASVKKTRKAETKDLVLKKTMD